MSRDRNLRIVVSCVSFETVKVVEPIKFYRADKAYLLHKGVKTPYDEFIREVERQLGEEGIAFESTMLDVYRFSPTMREVHRIIREERSEGNHVYVNIGAGPQIFCAAALVACMMEGGIPFNVGSKEFTVDSRMYFRGDRPVGLASRVHDPFPLPEFRLDAPDIKLVKGLAIWKRTKDRRGIMSASNIVSKLAGEDLLRDVEERKGKVSHGAIMRYRRNFLEPWIKNGWLEKSGRGHRLTDKGGIVLEIFHGD